ncbi:MAG: serine hydrolase domain-containing protein [Hyphomonas sp.]
MGKKWTHKLMLGLAALILAAGCGWVMMGPHWRALVQDPPRDRDILFWSQEQRDTTFRMLDEIPFIMKTHTIASGETVRTLPEGELLALDLDLDAYMRDARTASLVVLHNGEIRLERYGLDFNKDGRWTSFSVGKSLTSTLVGAAVKDGAIGSVDDLVTDYVPELAGSAYDGVTIEQVLTMTSGVDWNEDYDDPSSDVAMFDSHVPEAGMASIVSYMRTLKRANEPGEVWNYSTGETNLIGVIVGNATGKTVAEYLSEKIWKPYGMQQDATWLLGGDGIEMSGCCIQAATRDFARFGQFMLDGAAVDGVSILPEDWIATATTKQADYGAPGEGYGYQWWTWDDGSYQADGIFGQGIFIDPARNIVIASNSSWSTALGNEGGEQAKRTALYRAVQAATDAEQAQ